MRRTILALPPILGLLSAGPALAQNADPIGALLDQIPQSPVQDADEPDTAGKSLQVEPEPRLPPAPIPYVPPPRAARPPLTAPVDIMETGKSPDAPPSVKDLAYDTRIRSSFASAQSFQGPLDGAWTLSDGQGPLYALQLVDRGKGVLEGVWRDLRQSGAPASASGFVDEIGRGSSGLTLQFSGLNGQVAIQLSGGYSGVWQGRMTEAGRGHTVTMRKSR